MTRRPDPCTPDRARVRSNRWLLATFTTAAAAVAAHAIVPDWWLLWASLTGVTLAALQGVSYHDGWRRGHLCRERAVVHAAAVRPGEVLVVQVPPGIDVDDARQVRQRLLRLLDGHAAGVIVVECEELAAIRPELATAADRQVVALDAVRQRKARLADE